MFPREKARWVILRPWGKVDAKPFDVPHQVDDFHFLIHLFRSLNGQASIVMECMGHYYKPVVKVKTNRADSVKIARYTLDSWTKLKQ